MMPGTPDLLLMVTGTGHGGAPQARGDAIQASRSRMGEYTERVEYVDKPGGLFWGPDIGTGYVKKSDLQGSASRATTTGLKGKRAGAGTYVLVKVSR